MFVLKQKHYFFLLVFLLLPLSALAAWSEPTQNPPNGNTALPVYTTGSGQTIDGTLHVGTPGSYTIGLQGTGSEKGIQGNSPAAAVFGNLTSNAATGDKAIYGLAVDPNDFSASFSGGLGIEVASGDIRFRFRGPGIAWPRVLDDVPLAGLSVTNAGELRLFGHGAGINFMDQNLNSRLTVSEAGAVNVVSGPLTVGNPAVAVCLQSGAGCPSSASLWAQNGSDIYATNIGSDAVIGQNNAWSWGGNSDLYVVGGVRSMRFYDDDTNYYADLNSAGNLGGDWTFNGRVITLKNSTNNHYYIDSWNGIQLRLDNDNNSPDDFRINNGVNSTVLTVDEAGNLAASGNITAAGQSVCRADGTNCPAGASYWVPVSGTNDIQSSPSGAVRVRHELLFDSFNTAGNFIDFDPWQGNLGNYFLIKSGYNPSYGEKWHLRVNRAGETLVGSDLFVGNNNAQGVAVMTPYDNPTVNTSWAIRGKGTPTIEAVPGGGGGSRGDINLKSGYLTAGRSAWGGWGIDAGKYITTPSAYVSQLEVGPVAGGLPASGRINADQVCIDGDCRDTWSAVTGGSAAGWTKSGSFIYVTNSSDKVGIGISNPAARLQIAPQANVESLRIIAGNYSPFIIRDTADTTDYFRVSEGGVVSLQQTLNALNNSDFYLNANGNAQIRIDANNNGSNSFRVNNGADSTVFSVDENGNFVFTGTTNRIGGATDTNVPLAVKTNSNTGIRIECSAGGCNNSMQFEVKDANYSVIKSSYSATGPTNLILNPVPLAGFNGGNVGIGTTAPNKLLHLKTDNGNAEIDIQSASSPYWAMYQDDGSDDLRFWNTDNRLILKTNGTVSVPGTLSIGSMASNPYLRTETFANKTALGIKDPSGSALIYFGSDTGIGGGNGVTVTSNLYFTDTGGNPYGWIINNGGSLTAVMQKYCFGSDCKTGWGPNSGQRVYVPTATPGDGLDYVCPSGYVMVGIKNTSPGQLICDRMW